MSSTLIVLAILVVLCVGSVLKMYRNVKQGKGLDGSACSGDCRNCQQACQRKNGSSL